MNPKDKGWGLDELVDMGVNSFLTVTKDKEFVADEDVVDMKRHLLKTINPLIAQQCQEAVDEFAKELKIGFINTEIVPAFPGLSDNQQDLFEQRARMFRAMDALLERWKHE